LPGSNLDEVIKYRVIKYLPPFAKICRFAFNFLIVLLEPSFLHLSLWLDKIRSNHAAAYQKSQGEK
jgi:hypothetical protein